jgi:hypothetical protein
MLVVHLFDIGAIFCHDGLQAAAERAPGLVDVGQQHPVPLPGDGLMQGSQTRMGLAWAFYCKTLQIEKFSGFRSSEYGG